MQYGVWLPNPFARPLPVLMSAEAKAGLKALIDSIAAPTPKKRKPRK